MIHSKVMVVDDRLLRIGSANINNRSMGADTECDLVDRGRERGPARRRSGACATACSAEHCGASAAEVAQLIDQTGSLIAVADTLETQRPPAAHDRRRRARRRRDGGLYRTARRSGAPAQPARAGRRDARPAGRDRLADHRRYRGLHPRRAGAGLELLAARRLCRSRPGAACAEGFRGQSVGARRGDGDLHSRRIRGLSGHGADRGDRGDVRAVARISPMPPPARWRARC